MVSKSVLRSLLKSRKYCGRLSVSDNVVRASDVPDFAKRQFEIPGIINHLLHEQYRVRGHLVDLPFVDVFLRYCALPTFCFLFIKTCATFIIESTKYSP